MGENMEKIKKEKKLEKIRKKSFKGILLVEMLTSPSSSRSSAPILTFCLILEASFSALSRFCFFIDLIFKLIFSSATTQGFASSTSGKFKKKKKNE
jgi:hypothetical protein